MAAMGRCRGNTIFFESHNQFLQVFVKKGQESSGMSVSVNCQERAYSSSISPSGINMAILRDTLMAQAEDTTLTQLIACNASRLEELYMLSAVRVVEQFQYSTPDPFNGQTDNLILKPPKVGN